VTGEGVEEGTTVVSETVTDTEPSGGIPGYPLTSLLIGVAVMILLSKPNKLH
jgi:hypothetical protein